MVPIATGATRYPDHALGRDVFYRVRRVPLGLALMYGAGLISALLGIGSGVLKIPAMDTALRLPIKVSSATSNFMIGATAAASGVAYFARGDAGCGFFRIAGCQFDRKSPVKISSVADCLAQMPRSGGKSRSYFMPPRNA